MGDFKKEMRKNRRRHTIFYTEVVDKNSGRQVGRLADINTSGVLLTTEDRIENDQYFTLEVILPEEMEGHNRISFEAKSVWCDKDVNPDHYITGFEIEEISYRDKQLIVGFINQYGFQD